MKENAHTIAPDLTRNKYAMIVKHHHANGLGSKWIGQNSINQKA